MFRPDRSVLLVGWPRTGSSLLAEAMTATGRLGRVNEYFWRLQEPRHAADLGRDTPTDEIYEPYMDAVLRSGTTSNGVFGGKLFWAHAIDLVRRTKLMDDLSSLESIERLWAPFGDVRLVLIRRRCLRSALSLWRAEVTDEWGRVPGAPAPERPPGLDVWRVSELHADLHAADIGWATVLNASNRSVLELTYDEIAVDLDSALHAVARHAEVDLAPDLVATAAYARQADDATDAFERAWTAATGGCRECELNPLRA